MNTLKDMLKTENHFVVIHGIKIRYRQQGTGKKVVILLHGLGGFLENWHASIPVLAEQHTVYAIDLPGFGESDKPNCRYTIDFFLKVITGFIQHFHYKKVTLIGNSLGGGLALMMAIRHPNMIAKMVLASPVGFSKQLPRSFRLMSLSYINAVFLKPTFEKSRKGIKDATVQHQFITDEYVQLFFNYLKLPATKRALLNVLSSMATVFGIKSHLINEVSQNLPLVKHKTLIIWGKQDPLLPLDYARAQIAKLPNAELVALNNCGHVPQLEMPDAFNRLVMGFI